MYAIGNPLRIPKLGTFVLILGTSGCATAPSHDFCVAAHAILVSQQDQLTDGTAKQIEAHDETGAKLCGWK